MVENKKDKKIIKIIISIIIVLVILLIFVIIRVNLEQKNEEEEIERIKSYTTIDDFKTVEEVAKYLECDYIKQEKSKEENYDLDIYMKIKVLPYTDNSSNEGFYNKLISYCTKVLKFQNFRIIDKENNITIEVICDKENESIKSSLINGESNYFEKKNSEIQINNFEQVKETNLTIQSDVLTNLISNNWRLKESDIGTKESTFNSYDIYFDEGIEIRKVDNKVFNIVFTDKYKSNVVNNINTSTSKENIIKILGEPTFEDSQTEVIGYKGKDIYVFFNTEKEISIYRVLNNREQDEEFSKIIDSYIENNDIDTLINELKQIWTDYNKLEVNENGKTVQYSLRGIEITNNKINIYSNFLTKLYKNNSMEELKINLIKNTGIVFKNMDLVLKNEVDRNRSLNSTKYALEKYSIDNPEYNKNDKFLEYKKYSSSDTFSIFFISKTKEYANSELKEYANSGIWISDYIYVYSIKNKGMYAYDVRTRQYVTLATGDEEFKIISYENNTLKYDDKEINLK